MAQGLASTLLLLFLARLLLVAITTCWSLAISFASCIGQCGIAARDVHVLAVVRHMLQGKLGSVSSAQTHGASAPSQSGAPISSFCRDRGRADGQLRVSDFLALQLVNAWTQSLGIWWSPRPSLCTQELGKKSKVAFDLQQVYPASLYHPSVF